MIVSLPRQHVAHFSNRCVFCRKPDPNSHASVWSFSIHWLNALAGRPLFVCQPPACSSCAWLHHVRVAVDWLVAIAIVVAADKLLWPLVNGHVGHTFRKWFLLIAGLGLFLAYRLIREFVWPDGFSVSLKTDRVNYEFDCDEDATDFALWNGDAEWLKLDEIPVKTHG